MAYRNFYESSFWKNQQKTQSLSEEYEAGYSSGIKMLSQGAGGFTEQGIQVKSS